MRQKHKMRGHQYGHNVRTKPTAMPKTRVQSQSSAANDATSLNSTANTTISPNAQPICVKLRIRQAIGRPPPNLWGLRPFSNLPLSSPKWVAQEQSVDNCKPVDKRLDKPRAGHGSSLAVSTRPAISRSATARGLGSVVSGLSSMLIDIRSSHSAA